MIKRLLIANRGEIALRIVRACRELGIETVAVYSEADAHSPHVTAADQAVAIGAAPAADSYLSIARIVDAATSTGADALHPGYGFLAENAAFANACVAAGLIFVGPPPSAIARMGSKIEARRLVGAAGVPVVPGDVPNDQSDEGLKAAVRHVGLPAIIKASAGGGGKGMRQVRTATEIVDAVRAARREAQAAFGDGTLYVERLVDEPHHVEVQVFADAVGHVVHLFERECSVQRRHQKVIEESPSPVLTPALRSQMTAAAVAAARAVEYRNAGTIEFLVDVIAQSFYFLEMNTRLQVEHPVTEQVTGLDLVRAQLIVASGEPLPWTQAQIGQRGHAIEARIYAEDPAHDFLPQAGRLRLYREPHLPGIRIDSGVMEGSEISVYYDPMIAKVIATAESRPLAANRLTAALRAFPIEGVRTNVPFLIRILESPEFRDGTIDTAFLDRQGSALIQSMAAPLSSSGESIMPTRESQSLTRESRPSTPESSIPNPESRLVWDPWDPTARAAPAASAPPTRRASKGVAQSTISAPMPATVIKINVAPGDAVKKGDTLVLLEAMKMELPMRASGDATVAAVCCHEGELVTADAVLVEFK